jgi:hypothetical protein
MAEIDRIFEELTHIAERLDAPGLTPDERISLQERRKELHTEAGDIEGDDAVALMAELERLERRWEELSKQRIDVVKQAGGGSVGGDFGFAADAQRINRSIDESGGRAEIEARIKELRNRLYGT